MKKFLLALATLLMVTSASAQDPEGYYNWVQINEGAYQDSTHILVGDSLLVDLSLTTDADPGEHMTYWGEAWFAIDTDLSYKSGSAIAGPDMPSGYVLGEDGGSSGCAGESAEVDWFTVTATSPEDQPDGRYELVSDLLFDHPYLASKGVYPITWEDIVGASGHCSAVASYKINGTFDHYDEIDSGGSPDHDGTYGPMGIPDSPYKYWDHYVHVVEDLALLPEGQRKPYLQYRWRDLQGGTSSTVNAGVFIVLVLEVYTEWERDNQCDPFNYRYRPWSFKFDLDVQQSGGPWAVFSGWTSDNLDRPASFLARTLNPAACQGSDDGCYEVYINPTCGTNEPWKAECAWPAENRGVWKRLIAVQYDIDADTPNNTTVTFDYTTETNHNNKVLEFDDDGLRTNSLIIPCQADSGSSLVETMAGTPANFPDGESYVLTVVTSGGGGGDRCPPTCIESAKRVRDPKTASETSWSKVKKLYKEE